MFCWLRMRTPGDRRTGLPLSTASGGATTISSPRSALFSKIRCACAGKENASAVKEDEDTAVHGVDPGAVGERKARGHEGMGAGRGDLVALQGFEPRTCGL